MPIASINNITTNDRILVDDLPYIDQEYGDPSLRETVSTLIPSLREFLNKAKHSVFKALALVDEETKIYRPTKNYLEHLPQLDINAFEVSRIY